MAINVKAGLTKKIGPLPVWGYGLAVIGGYVGYTLIAGKGSGGNAATGSRSVATGAPAPDGAYPSSGAFDALSAAVDALSDKIDNYQPINNPGVPKPTPKPAPKPPAKAPAPRPVARTSGGHIITLPALRASVVETMRTGVTPGVSPPPSSSQIRKPVQPHKAPVRTAAKPAPAKIGTSMVKRMTKAATDIRNTVYRPASKPVARAVAPIKRATIAAKPAAAPVRKLTPTLPKIPTVRLNRMR